MGDWKFRSPAVQLATLRKWATGSLDHPESRQIWITCETAKHRSPPKLLSFRAGLLFTCTFQLFIIRTTLFHAILPASLFKILLRTPHWCLPHFSVPYCDQLPVTKSFFSHSANLLQSHFISSLADLRVSPGGFCSHPHNLFFHCVLFALLVLPCW